MNGLKNRIVLVGCGLAGPLLAMGLRRRGFPVEMFERRPDTRRGEAKVGRSINLAVSARGIHALQQAGLWEQVGDRSVTMKGRMIHDLHGSLAFQSYGKDQSEVIYSISRLDLHHILLGAAEASGAVVHFAALCTGVDPATGCLQIKSEVAGEERTVETGVLIGCDGAASAVRIAMQRSGSSELSQRYLQHGYKELVIPASSAGGHLEPHALHIWPRGDHMLIALPNCDGSFACTLFLPLEGPISFRAFVTGEAVQDFFRAQFPDMVSLLPLLEQQYFAHPVSSLITIKCFPWQKDGRMLLLGDAAHAMVPFFGQGMNCAFEDCTVLLELIDVHGPDWPRVFTAFQNQRREDADAISDLSLENFIEMRDKVADPQFLLQKKLELLLQARYPDRFVPKYAMVAFHRIPYSLARRRAELQDRLLVKLSESGAAPEHIDWETADRFVNLELPPFINSEKV